MLKRDEVDGASGPALGPAPRYASAPDLRNRQAAASYLQASEQTEDPMTRASLRRRAVALLEGRSGEGCERIAPSFD